MNRRSLFRLARRFCTVKSEAKEAKVESEEFVVDKKPQKIKFHPSELFPYRYRHEKYSLFSGFTEEELYGLTYKYKHSPPVEREIRKDTIMFLVAIFCVISYVLIQREVMWKLDESYYKYIDYDRNTVRSALPEKKQE